MQSGTLRDYSEDMYKVYFEIGEYQEVGLGVFTAFVGERHSKHILHLEFGYEVTMPIQCVPEVVRLLNQKNIAIYQIIRGEKTKETWR
ncbi:hypothetical protein [Photobacterium sanguinicancri]|uniref:Uncharacterized protein n=1 Tax=Photobacterium sanguinicancri TaxID=875932 RepID=A0AAW7Y8P9_9GAMM|nr:hypothetical protein [Photobacterium sanguinicancri]KXI20932.1 hypothetical protein AS132_23630 [Photobacterium sanguinicancri]MDO6544689.1 hypothetical protein [Photobacterium sanguinicancri]